jgi:hypothetical protein
MVQKVRKASQGEQYLPCQLRWAVERYRAPSHYDINDAGRRNEEGE